MGSRWLNRFVLFAAACLAVLGWAVPNSRGHCDGPVQPPAPIPAVPLPVATEWIYPLRWSWLHWWEANRDTYLVSPQQRVSQEIQADALKAQRDKAIAALTKGLDSPDAPVRAASALALGQMGEGSVLPKLTAMSRGDRSTDVQQMAAVAIGLLDGDEAITALAPKGKLTAAQSATRFLGLGLVSELKANVARQATTWGKNTAAPVRLAGVWCRGHVDGAGDPQVFTQILMRTDNPWIACEAMLALGRTGNKQAVPILADILLATDRGKNLPAWKRLEAIRLEKLDMAGTLKAIRTQALPGLQNIGNKTALPELNWFRQFYANYQQRLQFWQQDSFSPYPADDMDPQKGIYTIRLGWEEIYLGNLRAAAAIALGHIDSPAANQALMMAVQQSGDEFGGMWNDVNAMPRAHEFSHLHKGMALMSLGKLAQPPSVDLLTAVLAGNIVMRVAKGPDELANSPLRGYAAVALGLYARPMDTPQGPVDRPGFEKICELLGSYAANPNETPEVRTACTLALGLTGRTAYLPLFPALEETAGKLNDPAQIGFALMARAMMGDRNIIAAAKRFLDVPEVPNSTSDLIGRRATIMALGLHGAQEIIPILNAAWHQSHFVNREISNAMALCRGYSATDSLVDLLDNGTNAWARVFGARCLADLFMKDELRRVGRFLNDSNYAMRNNPMMFYENIANEFLMQWLIPAFGETWY